MGGGKKERGKERGVKGTGDSGAGKTMKKREKKQKWREPGFCGISITFNFYNLK